MNSLTSALQESLDVYELIKQQLYFSIPTWVRSITYINYVINLKSK